jgi:hypothetical protein
LGAFEGFGSPFPEDVGALDADLDAAELLDAGLDAAEPLDSDLDAAELLDADLDASALDALVGCVFAFPDDLAALEDLVDFEVAFGFAAAGLTPAFAVEALDPFPSRPGARGALAAACALPCLACPVRGLAFTRITCLLAIT